MPNPAIHPSSVLEPDVMVSPSARIGPHCYLAGHISIGKGTVLVGRVTLSGDGTIGDDCWIEPGVTTTQGVHRDRSAKAKELQIGTGAFIGANSVLAEGVRIGNHARIQSGTVVSRDVPAHAIVSGDPARITGYVTSSTSSEDASPVVVEPAAETSVTGCSVSGVTRYRFPRIRDLRGDLSVGEFERNVPFTPKRYFLVFDVPSAETRGEHAHRECKQFLICVSGRVSILVDDAANREEFELDAPNIGLYIPPKVWGVQYKYAPGSVLLVFASHYYDPNDYIRDYGLFLKEQGSQTHAST